jgi:hypothetical protein
MVIAPARGRVEAGTLPFCRFSILDGWGATGPTEYITHKAGPNDRSGVPQVVERIRRVFSIRPAFDVYIAKEEDNAFATVAGGRKILVVDVGFLEKLNRVSGTEWGAIQVIAHEIGHHIAGFSDDRHRAELNADYWSGQSLQRLGSARASAARAMHTFGADFDTSTHPNKRRRVTAIERGWDDAAKNRIDYSFCDDCR